MDTVQSNGLIFGQKHNDIDCALCPSAKRACDRAWCTAKNLEEWSEMSKTTLWRWLEKLEKARRISRVSDMTHVDVSTSTGAVKTTFYNLNASLNPKPMSRTKNENPLLQHTKARGFLFVVVKFTGGVGVSTTTKTLIRSLRSAQISGFNYPARRWADAQGFGISGVLTMLIQEMNAKEKPLFVATQTRAVRMTVPLVSRCRGSRRVCPRWELAYLILSVRRSQSFDISSSRRWVVDCLCVFQKFLKDLAPHPDRGIRMR